MSCGCRILEVKTLRSDASRTVESAFVRHCPGGTEPVLEDTHQSQKGYPIQSLRLFDRVLTFFYRLFQPEVLTPPGSDVVRGGTVVGACRNPDTKY